LAVQAGPYPIFGIFAGAKIAGIFAIVLARAPPGLEPNNTASPLSAKFPWQYRRGHTLYIFGIFAGAKIAGIFAIVLARAPPGLEPINAASPPPLGWTAHLVQLSEPLGERDFGERLVIARAGNSIILKWRSTHCQNFRP
jgi:hypothetical protein